MLCARGNREVDNVGYLKPVLGWGYFCVAVIFSVSYGLGCYTALNAPKPDKPVARLHQLWFNTIGAAAGWLAAWVVLVRWLSCPGFVCRDEPTGWTILLALFAFIGITGHLPLTVTSSISYIRLLLHRLLPEPEHRPEVKPDETSR